MIETISNATKYFIANTGINSTFNTTLDRKIDNKSLLTYGATQAAISTLWNSVGHNLVQNAIRNNFDSLNDSTLPLATTAANLIISSAIGTVVGKYMTDCCTKKPMTWKQSINTSILNSGAQFGLKVLNPYRDN